MNKFVMNHMPKVYFGEGALKECLNTGMSTLWTKCSGRLWWWIC